MKNVYNVFVNNESVSLKRGMFGYRVIHPNKNSEGNIIWKNLLFGGWGNLVTLVAILLILLTFVIGIRDLTSSCKDMSENPCNYFGSIVCEETPYNPIVDKERMNPQLNWSEVIKNGT